MIALIGKKIGMTREFYKTGQSIPVTVIKMEKGRVIDVIDHEKRGYKAIQLGLILNVTKFFIMCLIAEHASAT